MDEMDKRFGFVDGRFGFNRIFRKHDHVLLDTCVFDYVFDPRMKHREVKPFLEILPHLDTIRASDKVAYLDEFGFALKENKQVMFTNYVHEELKPRLEFLRTSWKEKYQESYKRVLPIVNLLEDRGFYDITPSSGWYLHEDLSVADAHLATSTLESAKQGANVALLSNDVELLSTVEGQKGQMDVSVYTLVGDVYPRREFGRFSKRGYNGRLQNGTQ